MGEMICVRDLRGHRQAEGADPSSLLVVQHHQESRLDVSEDQLFHSFPASPIAPICAGSVRASDVTRADAFCDLLLRGPTHLGPEQT